MGVSCIMFIGGDWKVMATTYVLCVDIVYTKRLLFMYYTIFKLFVCTSSSHFQRVEALYIFFAQKKDYIDKTQFSMSKITHGVIKPTTSVYIHS